MSEMLNVDNIELGQKMEPTVDEKIKILENRIASLEKDVKTLTKKTEIRQISRDLYELTTRENRGRGIT